jgi:predicted kinase
MVECVILIGLPASGKSTFYRERFAATHDHVSKDLMRNARRPGLRQEQLIEASLAAGRSVVVDNTNPRRADRAAVVAIARRHGARVVAYVFDTEAAEALRRNRAREGRDRVPDVAIFAARKRLEPPDVSEGFDAIYRVRMQEAERRFEIIPIHEIHEIHETHETHETPRINEVDDSE